VRALLNASDLPVEEDPVSELERRQRAGARLVLLTRLDPERAIYVTGGPDAPYELLVAAAAHLPDVAPLFPAAASYQAEAQALGDTTFAGIEPDPGVREAFGQRTVATTAAPGGVSRSRPLPAPRLAGEPVVRIPFGPVRDGTVESLLHRFHYLGEHILELEQHLGYKHRAVEGRLPSAPMEQLPFLTERVSGPNGVAFALATCQAVETACGITVPPRAEALRAIVAELERVYNHFRDIGRLVASTTLRVGAAQGHALQEWTQRIGAGLTGHRFLRGVVAVGGVRQDLDASGLAREASRMEVDARAYFEALEATELFIDRLETTGVLAPERARAWGAVGPVGRASDQPTDVRRDAPYGAYRERSFRVPRLDAGDALARFRVRCEEVLVSLYLVREIVEALPDGPVRVPAPSTLPPDAIALGWSEGVRGEVVAVLATDGRGRLTRVALRGGSRHNWPLFPDTVHDSFLMDYAINEASWGLSVASHDR